MGICYLNGSGSDVRGLRKYSTGQNGRKRVEWVVVVQLCPA